MLALQKIRKSYTTGEFSQVALDGVDIAFRDSEFVCILGPSGSGKTTMLNIIGGLDHYDSGDLIIDGISTKQYKDSDWDAYRNNRIGFVFQSYNLIPHQTVLANVELALTLSGVPRSERQKRAQGALDRVGLGEHANKKPNQLSGGQMQRVAIARALINDPEILLADEPTGALDSKTSLQIMDLLCEVAKDRLVVMVTHNPDLAKTYATRIVTLEDGAPTSDSDPFDPATFPIREAKPPRRTSMSFFTALNLSFNNLMTKKGRTIMTAFAGSIGIIGIASILALANGVNNYVKSIEEETLSEYPLSIESQSFDLTSMLLGASDIREDVIDGKQDAADETDPQTQTDKITEINMVSNMFESVGSNDLASLKNYFESGESDIEEYVNSIEYSYDVTPQIFSSDTSEGIHQVNPDSSFSALGIGTGATSSSIMTTIYSTDVFYEMTSDTEMMQQQYDVVAGHWPQNYTECILVLTPFGGISDFLSYTLGLRDYNELQNMVEQFANNEEVDVSHENNIDITYDTVLDTTFKLVNATDFYQYDETYNVWTDKSDDAEYLTNLVAQGEELRICGIVRANAEANASMLTTGIYYMPDLIDHIIEQASQTDIVQQQLNNPDIDVFTGKSFAEEAAEAENDPSFDMESLFTIDEDAFSAAFVIDEDALSLDLSGLAIDTSALGIDMTSLPSFDASALDLSSIDLSGIDLSNLDMGGLDMSGVNLDLSSLSYDDFSDSVDTEQLAVVISTVMAGFSTWYAQHITEYADMQEAMSAYMATDEVRAQVATGIASAVDTDQLSAELGAEIQAQLQEQLQEQLASQMQTIISTQIIPTLTNALRYQITTALSTTLQAYMESTIQTLIAQMVSAIQTQLTEALSSSMENMASNLSSALKIDTDAFKNAFSFNMSEQDLSDILIAMIGTETNSYSSNLSQLGYANSDEPYSIDIYPKDFQSKEKVIEILDAYNASMEDSGQEDKTITYTDLVGTLMSSVTTIINAVSYILIAFVAISLVVSSIMIGVITYISVLERRKEIGILRSIGASKGDVGRVFNAETIIEGLVAGLIGVSITALVCPPVSAFVYATFKVPDVADLPWQAAVILVLISVCLTLIAGIMPASSASRKDPVEALRSE